MIQQGVHDLGVQYEFVPVVYVSLICAFGPPVSLHIIHVHVKHVSLSRAPLHGFSVHHSSLLI